MVKIGDKIAHSTQQANQPFFSFEFFPPKTDAGVENLYLRMDRLASLHPIFVDITWGAGGITKDLTMAISEYSQTYFGVDVLMHLTCTNMTVDELKQVLNAAKQVGIQNILALRGDPPKGVAAWQPTSGGCNHAVDLVRLIRKEHSDYFGIAVAGFPEGHPNSAVDMDAEIVHLREKIDAGADFVLTQFFYDPQVFLDFVAKCRSTGINCPIIPGMMPIQSYSSFQRMTQFCRTKVPEQIWTDISAIRDDDDAVKAYGVQVCADICKKLYSSGIPGFHFYTLNLERSVLGVLKEIGVDDSTASRRHLPWRGPRTAQGGAKTEDVRPINWANRPKSYIKRTNTWDEFPNGRWGDGRSPAFGELSDSHFFRPTNGNVDDRKTMWGMAPIKLGDIYETFATYIEGKIPILPWCESNLQPETSLVTSPLAGFNRAGLLSINSQPAVNGERSDHQIFGWGGRGGRVYQRAYVEFFTSPENLKKVEEAVSLQPNLSYYAVNSSGDFHSSGNKGVTALTWGVFPNKEIQQPTIFDPDTFIVWSQEAFQLWTSAWASLYDDETESCELLYNIHDSFFLVAIIDNDYVEPSLFSTLQNVTGTQ